MTTVEHRWGDPGEPGSAEEAAWKKANLVRIHVQGIALLVHKELRVIFTCLVATLAIKGRINFALQADDWGFANRNVRDGRLASFHRTGQAVDLDARKNPRGSRRTTFPLDLTHRLCRYLGLRWGRDYQHSTPDPHHFEFIGTIEDAHRITAKLQKRPQRARTAVRRAARSWRKNPYSRPTRTLNAGDTGTDVKWLQWQLGLKTDGKLGPITYRALMAWQRTQHLDPDGMFGPRSLAKMLKVSR